MPTFCFGGPRSAEGGEDTADVSPWSFINLFSSQFVKLIVTGKFFTPLHIK